MKVKFIFAAVIVSAFCASCSNGQGSENTSGENSEATQTTETIAGADKDEHGCIASAGYCWSAVQGRCIRLWEEGVKLSYVEKDAPTAEFAAYLVFSADSAKVEFFAPKAEKPVLLEQNAVEFRWISPEFVASKISGKWVVKQNDVIVGIQAI